MVNVLYFGQAKGSMFFFNQTTLVVRIFISCYDKFACDKNRNWKHGSPFAER